MLELQRNVIFGQFIDTGSSIHRVDARIKLVATVVFIVASFLIDSFLGFALVLPRRWVVERTFAWLSQVRRLSKEDYERLPEMAEAMIFYGAMSRLMVRRLARAA